MKRSSISPDSILRSLLLFAIRFYRRRLSGRGPFARVSCTFDRLESCSAFGERVALQSPSTFTAIVRIARRLRRCRHLSLFRLRGGGLGWGRDYDALLERPPAETIPEFERSLRRDGETSCVSTAIGHVARHVAVQSGRMHRDDAVNASNDLPIPRRDAMAVRGVWRRRLTSRLAVTFASALAGAWLAATEVGGPVATASIVILTLWTGLSAAAAYRALRRLESLEVLSAIELPPRA